MIMLEYNETLYEALEGALRDFCGEINYIFIHAIYEPEDDGGPYEGQYCAAMDLYEPGMTYRVYFEINPDDVIIIGDVERLALEWDDIWRDE
jgi:hypothetical protein